MEEYDPQAEKITNTVFLTVVLGSIFLFFGIAALQRMQEHYDELLESILHEQGGYIYTTVDSKVRETFKKEKEKCLQNQEACLTIPISR